MRGAGCGVRPFKPQNMSNNAAVTADGGEIGRAQALQARACGVAASVHMNPVLLKPQSEIGAQVVVQGRVVGNYDARAYLELRPKLMGYVIESYAKVGEEADLVLVEGAGSPAEVNLRQGDIANMGFAQAADLPVVLVGDIERGGVIAALVGTFELLEADERARLKGYVVNKFRGDPALFEDAHPVIGARTGMRCFGVVPWFEGARRAAGRGHPGARGAGQARRRWRPGAAGAIRIAVPRLPRLANFDDLDPLAAEPDVRLEVVPPGAALPGDADLVILPGSKATLADLAALRAEGWDVDLAAHVRRGGAVLGICGGLQMLGRRLADPSGIEGPPAEAEGLGLLELATTLRTCQAARPGRGPRGRERGAGAGLRDARRRDDRPGARAADARARRAAGRRGLGGRAGHGLLPARPVRGRRLPPRFSLTPARAGGLGRRLRGAGRGRVGRAGRPSRGSLDLDGLLALARAGA